MEVQYIGTPEAKMSLRDIILVIRQYWLYLLRRWYILLAAGLMGALLGFLYFRYTPPKFLASSNFVIEESSQSTGDNSLAAMFGQTNSVGLFQGQNLQWLYTTNLMLQKTLMTPIAEGRKELIIDQFMRMDKHMRDMRERPEFGAIQFTAFQASFNKPQTMILDACVSLLKAKYLKINSVDKTDGVIRVDLISEDELFGKAFVETLVATVNEYYISSKTGNKVNQVAQLEKQVAKYDQRLNQRLAQSATETDKVPYPNPDLSIATIKPQRTNVDVALNTQMYTQTVAALEAAKIELAKATPLITVIDTPSLPLPIVKKSLAVCIAIGVGLLVMLTLVALIIYRSYKKIMAEPEQPKTSTVNFT